jgi:lipopolysaccharide export system protein LptA
MNRRPRRDACRFALIAGLLPLSAVALESDRRQPIEFGAETFDGVIANDGETRLSGSFWLKQGTLEINSSQALITRKAGNVVRVQISGAPATVAQQLDSGGRMRAEALDIDYDIGGDVLLLTRNVLVTQPEGALRGERVRYDIGSGRIQGGGEGDRVQFRIEPKPEAPATPAATEPATPPSGAATP